jgi:hypothetical protein
MLFPHLRRMKEKVRGHRRHHGRERTRRFITSRRRNIGSQRRLHQGENMANGTKNAISVE